MRRWADDISELYLKNCLDSCRAIQLLVMLRGPSVLNLYLVQGLMRRVGRNPGHTMQSEICHGIVPCMNRRPRQLLNKAEAVARPELAILNPSTFVLAAACDPTGYAFVDM